MASRRRWVLAALAFVITVGLCAVLGWYVWIPGWRPSLDDGERYGVDVSSHQGDVDWQRVAGDDIDFAYIKATEGRDFSDPRFSENRAEAKAAGLDVGAYHYFTLCSDPVEQAHHFLAAVGADVGDLPLVVDLEDLHGPCTPTAADVRGAVKQFVTEVETRTERPMVLYVGGDFEAKFDVRQALKRERWARRLFRMPVASDWVFWQAHWRAHVEGIDGAVDLDVQRAPQL